MVSVASAIIITVTGVALFAGLFANGGATIIEPFSLTAAIIVAVIWLAAIFAIYRLACSIMQWLDRH
jgi:hypothetical protein